MKTVSLALLKKALTEAELLELEKKIEAARSEPYKKPMTTSQYLNSLEYKKHELESVSKHTDQTRKLLEKEYGFNSPIFSLCIAVEQLQHFLSRDLNRQLAKEGMGKVRREV